MPYLENQFHATAVDDRGVSIGPQAGPEWLYVVPKGFSDLLYWLNKRYPRRSAEDGGRYDFKITENGLLFVYFDNRCWW